jgi:hypothetical protein
LLAVCADANATYGSCEDPYEFVYFRFELKETIKDERGEFLGRFEIENIRFEKEIVLEGTARNDVLRIDYPQIHLEFMDLTGSWVPFLYSVDVFKAPPNKRHLAPGATASFVTPLPTEESLALGGHKFRVLLSTAPDICIQSEPFVVIQKRGPIEGYKSEERSNKPLQRTLSKQRASER